MASSGPELQAEACTKRRPWNADEDESLKQLVEEHGTKNWALIATQLTMRNGKQCRERWRNHLRPELNKGDWTRDEDERIWNKVQEMGTKWAQISEQFMPERTDNDIKNRWNSIIRKQTHPNGRDWEPHENETRLSVLGASRTQQRRITGSESKAESKTESKAERKRAREAMAPPPEIGGAESAEALVCVSEVDSPPPLRKLFGSPEPGDVTHIAQLHESWTEEDVVARAAAAASAAIPTPSPNGSREPRSRLGTPYGHLEAQAEQLRAAGVLNHEICAITLDTDAILAEHLGISSISQISSPVRQKPAACVAPERQLPRMSVCRLWPLFLHAMPPAFTGECELHSHSK